jgi:hypothetical protein
MIRTGIQRCINGAWLYGNTNFYLSVTLLKCYRWIIVSIFICDFFYYSLRALMSRWKYNFLLYFCAVMLHTVHFVCDYWKKALTVSLFLCSLSRLRICYRRLVFKFKVVCSLRLTELCLEATWGMRHGLVNGRVVGSSCLFMVQEACTL